MTKDPNMFYPDDPDYPTGGPHAIYKDVFPRPGRSLGNPDWKPAEGDTPELAAAKRADFDRYTKAGIGSPEAMAILEDIKAKYGLNDPEKIARWIAESSGHQ